MSRNETDEEKLRTLWDRAVVAWDRIKITVMGLAILVTILTSTWTLSGTMENLQIQQKAMAETVKLVKEELTDTVTKLTARADAYGVVQSLHAERLASLESHRVWAEFIIQNLLLSKSHSRE